MDIDEILQETETYIEQHKLLLRIKYTPEQQNCQSQLKICLINQQNNRFQIEIRDEHIYNIQKVEKENQEQKVKQTQNQENEILHQNVLPFKFNLLWVKMLIQLGSMKHSAIEEDINFILDQKNQENEEIVQIQYLNINEEDLSIDPICNFSEDQLIKIKNYQSEIQNIQAILMVITYMEFINLQIQIPLIKQVKQKLTSQQEIQQQLLNLFEKQKKNILNSD
ncbi:hypothetical protein TTHERM_00137530 (macronuclear) [Tetrahymena thermophila SB210]|uniref:Uncharacterized protein n=1 Tax=Tetrahymena thermophila (strain SB210) TaxID=312017 RepID=I7MKL1_TETTS|nr:hypothetical protein TTHERM_00137530 [Tetrahymena thermophila SB210]EAR99490.1 hypothetical protein TTHERM_00137530 [Tetrahymena thermophila SB210]|eukprot:XP_001019735.1 hypothetical protein TTHERM_00137530 [Tetrahymena thermophila SB210]